MEFAEKEVGETAVTVTETVYVDLVELVAIWVLKVGMVVRVPEEISRVISACDDLGAIRSRNSIVGIRTVILPLLQQMVHSMSV